MEALLPQKARQEPKKPCVFGWIPQLPEILPQDPETGRTDGALVVANVVAGVIIGIRQGLSAVMTASLVFNTAGVKELGDMLGFGITMMWYSSAVSALWYGVFGRLQYGLIGINDVIGILWGTLGASVAIQLKDQPERIPATQLAIIMLSTLLTGAVSILVGNLGLGKIMLLFPAPVTSGFLGSIGFFIFKSSLQMASGTTFRYLWPVDWSAFMTPNSLGRVACMFAMLEFMWHAPGVLKAKFPKSTVVKKLGSLICQLMPLAVFYIVAGCYGISLKELTASGWTYPKQGSSSPWALWTTYSLRDADWVFVLEQLPSMGLIVMMSILCSMTGVLGITGKFPVGPPGDPAPTDGIDYDRELITAGWSDVLLGATGGIITFHRLGSTVQLRMDGGTHRISLFTCSLFCGGLFLSGIPIGHLIPRWFLGGLFMNSSIALLQDALFYFRHLPKSGLSFAGQHLPSPQYFVTIACIVVAILKSPFAGIGMGLILSIFLFLLQSSQSEPVSGVTNGKLSVGRTKRPVYELQLLRKEGDRILMLFLQGNLFFGSADRIAKMFNAVMAGREEGHAQYCVLSFARVVSIDSTAAQQVKASVRKAAQSGCHVLFCHMSEQVYRELIVAEAFKSPDVSLQRAFAARGHSIQSILRSGSGTGGSLPSAGSPVACDHSNGSPGREPETPAEVVSRRKTMDFVKLGCGQHDAFDTESDALDYCNDRLLEQFLYSMPSVEDYKMKYRQACVTGDRLDEAAFEALNHLPPGTMAKLRPFCQEHPRVEHYTVLEGSEPTLWFIWRGAIALFDQLPQEEMVVADGEHFQAEVKGFTGRGGKRLRCRLTPGHVAGKVGFSLEKLGVIDKGVMPIHQVSSRVAGYAELWSLTRSQYKRLPPELRAAVAEMLIEHLADTIQHRYLIE